MIGLYVPSYKEECDMSLKCPNPECEGQLTEYEHQGVKIDFCRQCGGSWFDPGETAQYFLLGQDLPDDAEAVHSFQYAKFRKKCPRDQQDLKEHLYTEKAKLLLDVCPHCKGIWFDSGEVKKLEQIAAQLDRKLGSLFAIFDFGK
jgi:Zn-finger nucleic acid-binding protein